MKHLLTILLLVVISTISMYSKDLKGYLVKSKYMNSEWQYHPYLLVELKENQRTFDIYYDTEILTFIKLFKIKQFAHQYVYTGYEYVTKEKYIIEIIEYKSYYHITLIDKTKCKDVYIVYKKQNLT